MLQSCQIYVFWKVEQDLNQEMHAAEDAVQAWARLADGPLFCCEDRA